LLYPVLVESLAWLVLGAVLAALAAWWLGRRHSAALGRCRRVLFGAPVAPPPAEPAARRFLRISFGVLWIVDGLLQAQPAMPVFFGREMLAPGIAASPPWLGDLIAPLARVWAWHPVTADAATVWLQVGLGVLFVVGGRGVLSRFTLSASIAWSLVVWVAGEFLGGMLWPGAGWLVGSPGAVLVYILAAVLLLAPWHWWDADRAASFARRSVGAWMVVGAALQALPWEGFWNSPGLAAPFADGASVVQPVLMRQPIAAMATAAASQPGVINAALVAALLVVGGGLFLSRSSTFVVAGVLLCLATWWLAQDFGVLGGNATDPNTALPLALLLACALPFWRTSSVDVPVERVSRSPSKRPALQEASTAGFAVLGLGALVVAPLFVTGLLLGPADSAALAADSGGGLVQLPLRPAPGFALVDQNGHDVSLGSLGGTLTLVTFLDPVCSDECPVIANQLATADRALGPLAKRVEIVAIDSNPVFHTVGDVAAFTRSHGLSDLPNWHFLAGSANDLQSVLSAYGIVVQVPTVGMIEHGEGIYFLDADGSERAYLGDGADVTLTGTYAAAVEDEIRRLLVP
jgi:cytochrome oxidase Cu insertion factor (SCO1/SenC/PrrC family)